MSNTIHGLSHKALKHLRQRPAALAVYWIYISRTNNENVAWPSLRGLESDTGWNRNTCKSSRDWLIEHKALERVPDYTRPDWRSLDEAEFKKRANLDKAEYYRPTGYIEVNGERFEMLYFGKNETSGIEDTHDVTRGKPSHDVTRRRTSKALDIERGEPELDSITTKLEEGRESRAIAFQVPSNLLTPSKEKETDEYVAWRESKQTRPVRVEIVPRAEPPRRIAPTPPRSLPVTQVQESPSWKAFAAGFDDNPPVLAHLQAVNYLNTVIPDLEKINATPDEITAVVRLQRPKPRKGAYRFDFLPADIHEYRETQRKPAGSDVPAIWRPIAPPQPIDPSQSASAEERKATLARFEQIKQDAYRAAQKKAAGE